MLTMKTPGFEADFDIAQISCREQTIEYSSKLLLPGQDAAIVITPHLTLAFLDNAPCPVDHAFSACVARRKKALQKATAKEFRQGAKQVSILGRWHENGPDHMDFEPYITRKTGPLGTTSDVKYDYEIFPFDGLRSGEGAFILLNKGDDGAAARRFLTNFADRLTHRRELSKRVAISLGLPTGVVWYPPSTSGFPILVAEWSHADDRLVSPHDATEPA